MQTENQYLRIYEDGPVPSFSFEELQYLANDATLNKQEMIEFKCIYLKAKERVEKRGVDPSKIVAFVRPESGDLALTIGGLIKIDGANDTEISYDEFTSIAFDINTPDHLSLQYQEVLLNAKKTVEDWDADWHRFIFVRNIYTGKVRTWFD